ncbi:hypothetical protein T492DRAFT_886007 [Pavlovales sp. CCMP2436]|nr:hypothetical protein T492DRAFT_886007 [Pavlovales sp. CCMP2436]
MSQIAAATSESPAVQQANAEHWARYYQSTGDAAKAAESQQWAVHYAQLAQAQQQTTNAASWTQQQQQAQVQQLQQQHAYVQQQQQAAYVHAAAQAHAASYAQPSAQQHQQHAQALAQAQAMMQAQAARATQQAMQQQAAAAYSGAPGLPPQPARAAQYGGGAQPSSFPVSSGRGHFHHSEEAAAAGKPGAWGGLGALQQSAGLPAQPAQPSCGQPSWSSVLPPAYGAQASQHLLGPNAAARHGLEIHPGTGQQTSAGPTAAQQPPAAKPSGGAADFPPSLKEYVSQNFHACKTEEIRLKALIAEAQGSGSMWAKPLSGA